MNGLKGTESNKDARASSYPVFEFPPGLAPRSTSAGQPLDESLDPCHAPDCVAQQLEGGNGGFVKNFIAKKQPRRSIAGLPMGYFTADPPPVYDFLARTFCVCDAWHSSVPGDTWPNRLYSLAGHEGEPVAHRLGLVWRIWLALDGPVAAREHPDLRRRRRSRASSDDTQWRWYSHDPGHPARRRRALPATVRTSTADNFAYFNRKSQPASRRLPRRRSSATTASSTTPPTEAARRLVDRPQLHRPARLRPDLATTTTRRPTSARARRWCWTSTRRW